MPAMDYERMKAEVLAIKRTSVELAGQVAAANSRLSKRTALITSTVRGSATGMRAANSLATTQRMLTEAVGAMNALAKVCDRNIADLSK